MLTKIKETVYKLSKAAGLEITLLPDHGYRITLVLLILEKKSIRIEKVQQWERNSLEDLHSLLDKSIPVYLALGGRGILHKKIAESGSDSKVLIQSVLPNAKPQDFYIQNIISEKGSVISMVRKELADPILETIQKMGLSCIGVSLGGIVVTSVLPLIQDLTIHNSTISWAGHSLELEDSETVTDYRSTENSKDKKYFQIDTEKIEDDFLVAYAAAFSALLNLDPVVPFIESIVKTKEEFLNKQLFQKLSWLVLGFFLVVLLINFSLFTRYSSRNNELVQKESKFSTMLTEMEKLTKEVKEKESFLSEAGWLNASLMTYFADRIAATVPMSVKLTELSINPSDERKSKEAKKELFTTGIIVVKGECTRPTELNEWLDKIKQIDKISKARLVHYTYDIKANQGSFSIDIAIEN